MRRYYAVMCSFAQTFLPDTSLAEDVTQESFIKLWRSGKTFDSPGALKAYLYAMTRNGCLDLIRNRNRLHDRHQRATSGEEEAFEPDQNEVIWAESVALIYEVVETMPEKMQQVFLLSFRDGMSVSEISAHLGVNLKAVKKQKYKLLVTLRGRFSRDHRVLMGALWVIASIGKDHT